MFGSVSNIPTIMSEEFRIIFKSVAVGAVILGIDILNRTKALT